MVVKVTIPNPPNWIKSRITPWPKAEKVSPIFTVDRPVTQILDTATNNPSRKSRRCPLRTLKGSIRHTAPATAPRKNPSIIILVAVSFLFFISLLPIPAAAHHACLESCPSFSVNCILPAVLPFRPPLHSAQCPLPSPLTFRPPLHSAKLPLFRQLFLSDRCSIYCRMSPLNYTML